MIAALRQVAYFKKLSTDELMEIVHSMRYKYYKNDSVIIGSGSKCQDLGIIIKGSLIAEFQVDGIDLPIKMLKRN